MKTLVLHLFFLLVTTYVYAQVYHPIALEGAHWIVAWHSGNEPPTWTDDTYSVSVRGDSTLDGKTYKKVFYDEFFIDYDNYVTPKPYQIVNSQLMGLLRDDTLEQKVYYYPVNKVGNFFTINEGCTLGEEVLLFDFSVIQGDTLNWCALTPLQYDYESPFIADSVKSERIYEGNGMLSEEKRKVIYSYGWFPFSYGLQTLNVGTIVEGYGYDNYGPFISGGEYWVGYCLGSDADCGFLTSTNTLKKYPIQIYPNPSYDYVTLENLPTKASVQIYDLNGTLKAETQQRIIDLSTLPQGVYFIEVNLNQQVIWSGKLLKI